MRALVLSALVLLARQAPVAPRGALDARASTFRVEVEVRDDFGLEVLDGWYGTAWVAFNESAGSYLVTAGHVCDTGTGKARYTLMGYDSQTYEATRFVTSADGDPDLCILRTGAPVGPAMAISPEDPSYDEPITYVGAPSMVYGEGMAPVFRGVYAGGELITAPVAGGASGSAVFTSRGVVGVVVRVNRRMSTLGYMVQRKPLLAFLREHGLPL